MPLLEIKKYWPLSLTLLLFACQKHSPQGKKLNKEVAAFYISPVCNGMLTGGLYVVDSNFEFVNRSYLKDSTDRSNIPVVAYRWDFGDGSVSTDKNPSHRYTLPGTYTASLVTYVNNQPSDTSSALMKVVMGLREYRMNTAVVPIDVDQAAQKGAIALYTAFNNGGPSSTYNLLRVDSLLNLRWSRSIPGGDSIRLSSIKQINNGAYILTGNYQNGNTDEFCLTEIDSSGNLVWNKYLNNLPGQNTCAIPLSDGGFLTGGTTSVSNNNLAAIVKCDANGNEIWRRVFDSTVALVTVNNLLELDSGYVFGSITAGPSPDLVLTLLDFNGNIKKQTAITPGYPVSSTSGVGVLYQNGVFLVWATIPGINNYLYLFDGNLNFTGNQAFVQAPARFGFNDGGSFVLVSNNGQYVTFNQVTTDGAVNWLYTLDPTYNTSCTSYVDGASRYCPKAILTSDNEIIVLASGENLLNFTQNVIYFSSLYMQKLTPDGKTK